MKKNFASLSFQKGFTLVSLLAGVVASSVLLLTIAQLASMSSRNFGRNQKIIDFYVNTRVAIQFLREQVPMAGLGIRQPRPERQTNYTSRYSSSPQGGAAALREWVYVGDYTGFGFTGSAYYYALTASSSNSIPQQCADLVGGGFPDRQFFGLTDSNRCYFVRDPGRNVARNPQLDPALPSQTNWTCCDRSRSASCPQPYYNCGVRGSGTNVRNNVMATYQKLRKHIEVTSNGSGGDSLKVYFTNYGPSNITTFTGGTLSPVAAQPTYVFSSYEFRVNSTKKTLEAIDSITGTVHEVANNVEYMAVLVGESDRLTKMTINSQTDWIPELNRYASYSASNLYPYRITSVRIALVMRSENDVLTSAASATNLDLKLGNGATFTTTSDRRMHQVFITTIYLNGYTLPAYQAFCAQNGSSYRLKTGGIPFDRWRTNDQCCDCTNRTYNACEERRLQGNYTC